MSSLCDFLEWDSELLQHRIARLVPTRLDAGKMQAVLQWCTNHSIDCLYALVEADDADLVRLMEAEHFQLVDVRLTLEKKIYPSESIDPGPESDSVRLGREEDIPLLREIGKVSYRNARFYYDAKFSTYLCDRLHEEWVENSYRGYAQAVWVAEDAGVPASFITCHLPAPGEGQIGLVGVSPAAKGKGLGTLIVQAALRWFAEQGVTRVTVVTQARNIIAQRLYHKCGFTAQSTQLWYHRWFT